MKGASNNGKNYSFLKGNFAEKHLRQIANQA